MPRYEVLSCLHFELTSDNWLDLPSFHRLIVELTMLVLLRTCGVSRTNHCNTAYSCIPSRLLTKYCWLSVNCLFSCGLVSAPLLLLNLLVGLKVYLAQFINMLVSKFIENLIQNLFSIEFLLQIKIFSRHWLIFLS